VPFIPALTQWGSQKYSNEPALVNVCVNVAPFALWSVLRVNTLSSVQFAPETTSWFPPAQVHVTVSPILTEMLAGVNLLLETVTAFAAGVVPLVPLVPLDDELVPLDDELVDESLLLQAVTRARARARPDTTCFMCFLSRGSAR